MKPGAERHGQRTLRRSQLAGTDALTTPRHRWQCQEGAAQPRTAAPAGGDGPCSPYGSSPHPRGRWQREEQRARLTIVFVGLHQPVPVPRSALERPEEALLCSLAQLAQHRGGQKIVKGRVLTAWRGRRSAQEVAGGIRGGTARQCGQAAHARRAEPPGSNAEHRACTGLAEKGASKQAEAPVHGFCNRITSSPSNWPRNPGGSSRAASAALAWMACSLRL